MSRALSAFSKRTLGMAYLVGTGGVVSLVLAVRGVSRVTALDPTAALPLSGLPTAIALTTVHRWAPCGDLDDEGVWRLAEWGSLGLAIVTLSALGLFALAPLAGDPFHWAGLTLAAHACSGGLAGVLAGGLREHDRRADDLAEKHAVLNRVLRHDIRNDMGVIRAQVETLESHLPASERHRIDAIERRIDRVVELSWTARTIQRTVDPQHSLSPIDLVALLERRVERLEDDHPDVTVETDLPESSWVYADALLDTALEHLLRNSVEHGTTDSRTMTDDTVEPGSRSNQTTSNDAIEHGDPGNANASLTVRITLDTAPSGGVVLRIADDGPGIPESVIDRLAAGTELPTEHSLGTGLWVVKWLIERYGGTFAVERRESGTAVKIAFQPAPAGDVDPRSAIRRFFR